MSFNDEVKKAKEQGNRTINTSKPIERNVDFGNGKSSTFSLSSGRPINEGAQVDLNNEESK